MNKIREFLSKIEKDEKEQYFLLYKFYINPNLSLGGSEEATIEKYYEFGDIKHFILNNTFFEFLKICLEKEEFKEKLDFNLLRKIRFILYDSKQFKEQYFSDLEDEYLRNFCKGKVPIGENYSKKYNKLQLLGIAKEYERHGWLYELGLNKRIIDTLDINLIDELIRKNSYQLDIYYEIHIKPEEEKKYILNKIKNDDYSEDDSCFLAVRGGRDIKVLMNLVCNNDFLKLLEELLQKDLPSIVIQHILEILEISINFKTMNVIYEDFYFYYNKIGEEKIKLFDYKKAKELVLIIKSRKNKKLQLIKS